MEDKLVSIVVTSYNHAAFLPQRMESLLAQTHSNIEILVVDDCSTDGSREYLLTWETHPKVSLYFLESNKGYVYTSNYGASKAKGDYIVFAECDDFSEPNQIASLYQAITASNSVGVAWSCSNLTDEHGNFTGRDFDIRSTTFQNYCERDVLIPGSQILKFMLHSSVVPNMSAALFKKSLFTRIGGLSDKYKLSADLDFWVRMAEISDFYYLKKPLNNFRTHFGTVRNLLGTSIQLIETIDIASRLRRRIKLTFREKIALHFRLGNLWYYNARNEFSTFGKTFFTVLSSTFKQEPFLLFFMLVSLPVLSLKRIGKLLNL